METNMGLVANDIPARRVKNSYQRPRADRANVGSQERTTRIERLLLMMTIALMPLEEHVPNIAGFSIIFILFGVLACYVLLNRSDKLAKTWLHPLFLTEYGLICLGFWIEFSHPYSSYSDILRMGQMIAGAVFVASLCRDQRALRAAIYGYIVAGLFMAIVLFMAVYTPLSQVTATDFGEAEKIRSEVFLDNPLEANLNAMAFIAAQGTLVALGLALTARSIRRRCLFFVIVLFCFTATFLPLSRTGVVIIIVGCAAIMIAYGVGRARTLIVASLVVAGSVIWVPQAVWQRMSFSIGTPDDGSYTESRARIYSEFFARLPEFVVAGVGAGNFWGPWGRDNGFGRGQRVVGLHNAFFQATVYWGMVGLLVLLAVAWQAYRCLPKRSGNNGLALGLLGIAVSLMLISLAAHSLYGKEYSLGFGLMVGARLWIWTRGIVAAPSKRPTQPIVSVLNVS